MSINRPSSVAFSNRRWRKFIATVHDSVTDPCSVTYPMVLGALRSGPAWFNDDGPAIRGSTTARRTHRVG
jgi:hypothetical protein